MTALQYAFLAALSASLLAVTVFAAATLRVAVLRRGDGFGSSWVVRLGAATRPGNLSWAFVAHRITGVAIFAFLVVHIADVSVLAASPAAFDEIHRLYGTAPMRVFESLLLYAILFHTLNGLRLLLLDVSALGPAASRRLLRIAVAGTLAAGSAGSVVILRPLWS